MESKDIITQIKYINSNPEIKRLLKELELNLKHANKYAERDCIIISHVADGMDYQEAYDLANQELNIKT
jgi:hypothetical protein